MGIHTKMKALQALLVILLTTTVFTVKKNVKTVTLAQIQARADPDLSDMDIHKVMNDMTTNFDDLNDQKHFDNVHDKQDNYQAAMNTLSQQINNQKPVSVNCTQSASNDCLGVSLRNHA